MGLSSSSGSYGTIIGFCHALRSYLSTPGGVLAFQPAPAVWLGGGRVSTLLYNAATVSCQSYSFNTTTTPPLTVHVPSIPLAHRSLPKTATAEGARPPAGAGGRPARPK